MVSRLCMAPVPDSNYSGDGFELIVCHIVATRNWGRVVRGLLTLRKLRAFFGVLGHYLKEVKQRGLAVDMKTAPTLIPLVLISDDQEDLHPQQYPLQTLSTTRRDYDEDRIALQLAIGESRNDAQAAADAATTGAATNAIHV